MGNFIIAFLRRKKIIWSYKLINTTTKSQKFEKSMRKHKFKNHPPHDRIIMNKYM
jgi:hypothetical protein